MEPFSQILFWAMDEDVGNFSGACIRWTAKLMKVMAYFLKLPPGFANARSEHNQSGK